MGIEQMKEEMNTNARQIVRYGEILTDITFDTSRILNVQYGGSIWFIRYMNGKCHALLNLNDPDHTKSVVRTDYTRGKYENIERV